MMLDEEAMVIACLVFCALDVHGTRPEYKKRKYAAWLLNDSDRDSLQHISTRSTQ